MTPAERLRGFRERQLALLASYGELQGKIEESVRAGEAGLLAVQALEALRLAEECGELERAARPLAARSSGRPEELEARLEAGRQAALEAGRRCRASLRGALQELAARIRDLAARPRTPPSPFARIGQPVMIDLES